MTPTRDEIDALLSDISVGDWSDGTPDGTRAWADEMMSRAATMLRALRDQREADARTCVWSPDDDEYCPGTWDGACGAKWTFTEGGVVDNDMHYCPQCGGKVTVAAMPAQGEK